MKMDSGGVASLVRHICGISRCDSISSPNQSHSFLRFRHRRQVPEPFRHSFSANRTTLVSRIKLRDAPGWLEARGYTNLIERPFDEFTKAGRRNEPYVALCGFDKAKPRRILENAGFDLIVECALGANADRLTGCSARVPGARPDGILSDGDVRFGAVLFKHFRRTRLAES